jgi:CHASE2 domain
VLLGAALIFYGMKYYLTPWSQAIINGIVKYTYGTRGQSETTVVLFREENLRALNESYPVSYQRHAEILEALSLHRPRAVFMDFVFNLDQRADAALLRDAICGLHDAGIRVYLAVLSPVPRPTKPGERSVFDCSTKVSAQMDAVHGGSGVLTYAHGVRVNGDFLPTPAFAMAETKVDPDDAAQMEIIWGNGVASLNEQWMAGCARAGSWVSHLVSLFAENPLKSVKLRCPYTRTITVGHLLGTSTDADVARAIEGSAVFYGAAFHLTGDRVVSPVFEELPGVYLHAMAYDNLRTLREDYKRAERQFLLPSLGARKIPLPLTRPIDLLLLLVTVSILLLVEEPPPAIQTLRGRSARIPTSIKCMAMGLTAVFVVVMLWVQASIWLALLGVLILMVAIAVLDLAPPAERPPHTLQQFVVRRLLTLVVPIAAVAAFIAVDRTLGLEAAILLVAVPAYFLYKVIVARDMLFAATAILLVLAALVAVAPPVNLGPRNVVAYVVFFELARKLLKHADGIAAQYFKLRDQHPADHEWGWAAPIMPTLDRLFAVCRSGGAAPNTAPQVKEETHAKPAGAPA